MKGMMNKKSKCVEDVLLLSSPSQKTNTHKYSLNRRRLSS